MNKLEKTKNKQIRKKQKMNKLEKRSEKMKAQLTYTQNRLSINNIASRI